MATKNQMPDSAAQQQPEETRAAEPQPKDAGAQKLLEIGALCEKHQIRRAVFAGVCTANGWKPGKAVTEEEFLKAVKHFEGSSIDGRPGKVKKESEARK